jgi:deoxyribodipyrimidine photo-lyase
MQPTRVHALKLLSDFIPAMGPRYTKGRNFDHGPGKHKSVSELSSYVRRRLILEQELVSAAIDMHGATASEKFIEEVFWRGYFKGWLERRPQVWADYVQGLTIDLAHMEKTTWLAKSVAKAESGQTGIDCFDAWARELITTGYLHNHARMWFASIWIFTLNLPWRIGADFFYRNLLDGDPASNTLSWRWVAGLHTRGKPYEAKAWNIETFTGGRFSLDDKKLAANVIGLEHTEPEGLPAIMPLRSFNTPDPSKPSLLLITEEDCHLEDFNLENYDIRAVATLDSSHLRSPRKVAELVIEFEIAALEDAAQRIGKEASKLQANSDLIDLSANAGVTQFITPYITQGPLFDWLQTLSPTLNSHNITLTEWRRDWDALIWPHATAGFFKVKQQIPRILDRVLP